MNKSNEFFNSDHIFAKLLLATHQILGGILGVVLVLLERDLSVAASILLSLTPLFSIYAGYLMWNKRDKAVYLSSINYFLQCLDFQIDGLFSFRYNLPLSVVFGFDFTKEIVELNILLATSIQVFLLTELNDLVAINFTALMILIFLGMDRGLNLKHLNLEHSWGV